MLGVTSLRDTLLPLLSLRGLLGFPPRAGVGRAREGRRHEGRRRPGRAGGRPRARDRRRPTPTCVDADPAGARGAHRRRSRGSRPSIAARTDAGWSRSSSPEQLFREDVMQRLKATAARRRRRKHAPATSQRTRSAMFLVFRLGDDEFGLPIEAVDEVAQVPDADHARAEDAEVPRRRRQPARRRAAGRRPAPPLRHAGARATRAAAGSSSCAPSAIAPGLIVDSVSDVLRMPGERRRAGARPDRRDRRGSCAA